MLLARWFGLPTGHGRLEIGADYPTPALTALIAALTGAAISVPPGVRVWLPI